jgi:hypothetical protein
LPKFGRSENAFEERGHRRSSAHVAAWRAATPSTLRFNSK